MLFSDSITVKYLGPVVQIAKMYFLTLIRARCDNAASGKSGNVIVINGNLSANM